MAMALADDPRIVGAFFADVEHHAVGWNFFHDVVKPIAHGAENIAKDVGHGVEHMAKAAAAAATFHWDEAGRQAGNLVHDVESISHELQPVWNLARATLSQVAAVVSLIPGIGTGLSSAINAALAFLDGGGPLEIAIKMAYGAIPIPPGIKYVTDMVLDAVLSLLRTHDLVEAAIAAAKAKFPPGLPRDVFDTLIHVVVGGLTHKPTRAVATPKAGTPSGAPVHVVHTPPRGAPRPTPATRRAPALPGFVPARAQPFRVPLRLPPVSAFKPLELTIQSLPASVTLSGSFPSCRTSVSF